MKEFNGILKMKIEREGSRSEGPAYYLELSKPNEFGQSELKITKTALLWQKESKLHNFINKKVNITGESVIVKHVKLYGATKSESITYYKIKEIESD